jgi:hypothetical protein
MNTIQHFFHDEHYTPEEIKQAALIIHPKCKKYNVAVEEIAQVFEQ